MSRKSKDVVDEAPQPATERLPDFQWSGRPVFRCSLGCGDRFERVDDVAAVLEHEATMHPTNINRESLILGPDGRPAQVEN